MVLGSRINAQFGHTWIKKLMWHMPMMETSASSVQSETFRLHEASSLFELWNPAFFMVQNDRGSTRELLIRYILLAEQCCDDTCQFSILEPPFGVALPYSWSHKLMFPSGSTLLAGTLSTDATWSLHHKAEKCARTLHQQTVTPLVFHFCFPPPPMGSSVNLHLAVPVA